MHPFLRGLLEPALTSPFDPDRPRGNRSVGAQVMSGFRIVGGLVAVFLIVVLALAGVSTLPEGAPAYGRFGLLVSWSAVCVASLIMFLAANRWVSFVPYLCGAALF